MLSELLKYLKKNSFYEEYNYLKKIAESGRYDEVKITRKMYTLGHVAQSYSDRYPGGSANSNDVIEFHNKHSDDKISKNDILQLGQIIIIPVKGAAHEEQTASVDLDDAAASVDLDDAAGSEVLDSDDFYILTVKPSKTHGGLPKQIDALYKEKYKSGYEVDGYTFDTSYFKHSAAQEVYRIIKKDNPDFNFNSYHPGDTIKIRKLESYGDFGSPDDGESSVEISDSVVLFIPKLLNRGKVIKHLESKMISDRKAELEALGSNSIKEKAKYIQENLVSFSLKSLSDNIFLKLICQESVGDPTIESSAKAFGLTQLMPITAEEYFGENTVKSRSPSIYGSSPTAVNNQLIAGAMYINKMYYEINKYAEDYKMRIPKLIEEGKIAASEPVQEVDIENIAFNDEIRAGLALISYNGSIDHGRRIVRKIYSALLKEGGADIPKEITKISDYFRSGGAAPKTLSFLTKETLEYVPKVMGQLGDCLDGK